MRYFPRRNPCLVLMFAAIVLSALCPQEVLCQTPSQTAQEVSYQASVAATRSAALSAAVKQYQTRPDSSSWDAVWRVVHDILTQPTTVRTPAASLFSTYPALSEIGAAVKDAEGGRVWVFPKVAESQNAILQWSGSVASTVVRPVGRRHRMVKTVSVTMVPKAQVLTLTQSVVLNDAHLVHGVVIGKDKKPVAGGARVLVLTGNVRGTGAVWLQAYRLSDNIWVESTDVFSGVPPFLTQNLIGKAAFSNNDLVLTVGGGKSSNGKQQPQSAGYKIVLHFVEGRFSLDSRTGEEGPALVALQFVQAIQQGRTDLARGWLVDSRLISIPKYIGLTRAAGQPFKLIAMANPGSGVSRYRLMTFEKNDLILDVGKVKNQWAIKALFIAPPDPLAQKLVGSLPAAEKAAEPKPADPNK